MLPHLRDFAVIGPLAVTGVSDTPSRRKIFTCRPTTAAEEAACAARDRQASWRRRRFAARSAATTSRTCWRSTSEGRQAAATSRPASAWRCRRSSPARASCSASRKRRRRCSRRRPIASATRTSRRGCRSSSGARCPDAELLKAARSAHAARRRGVLEKQVKRMLADPRAEALATRFAVAVAAPAGPRQGHPGLPAVSAVRRHASPQAIKRETELFFDSLVREDRSRPRPADRRLLVRQRAAGAALRHPERQRARRSAA